MSGVRDTSREAYKKVVISGKAQSQRNRILRFMERHQLPRNRREISVLTGFPINIVTARVNALIKNGDLVEEHFCVDPVTKHRVWYVEVPYRVTPASIQPKLPANIQSKLFED